MTMRSDYDSQAIKNANRGDVILVAMHQAHENNNCCRKDTNIMPNVLEFNFVFSADKALA